ncbi:MAG TPA: hypothetical protein VHX20_11050 [Terracidiphilus sp.]|jgi:hypothetical protein|nr:hypothetical protein [Terracidiphilus sp.]
MTELRVRPARPQLKQLVAEASHALATLDADRLEELALSCQALNRDLAPGDAAERASLARQAREAVDDMAVFGRVLAATRANLKVLRRLRALREGCFDYGSSEWTGSGHGHD